MGMGITGAMQLFGGSDKDLYGSRAVVPEIPDFQTLLEKLVKGNAALLPSLGELGKGATELYRQMMETATPGITKLKDEGTAAIQDMIRGTLSPEMTRQLRQDAAESGTTTGTSGSGVNVERYLQKNLGLRLGRITEGLNTAQRWMAQAQSQTFDFSKLMWQKDDMFQQADRQWNRDWLAAQVEAAPDPQKRGAFDSEMAFVGMVLSAYGGGAGYTGQYKGQNNGGGYQGNPNGADFDRSYDTYFGGGGQNNFYDSNASRGVYSGQNYNLDNMGDYSNVA